MVDTPPSADTPAPATEPRHAVLERRGEARYPAGRVLFRSGQIQASLVDLSRGGLAIESLEHPAIGSAVDFALVQGRSRAEAEGTVRWCNLKRTYRTAEGDVVAVYRAGVSLGDDRPRLLDSITRGARLDWVAGNA